MPQNYEDSLYKAIVVIIQQIVTMPIYGQESIRSRQISCDIRG